MSAIKQLDHKVLVALPSGRLLLMYMADGLRSQEIVDEAISAGALPVGTVVAVKTASLTEQQNRWLDALVWEEEKVCISLPLAKELRKQELRRARKPLLEALDAQLLAAARRGSSQEALHTEAQRLCDLPQLVDAASSVAAVDAVNITTGA